MSEGPETDPSQATRDDDCPDPFDDPRHRESESLVFLAERRARAGDVLGAKRLYADAAEKEAAVAVAVGAGGERTDDAYTVFGVSAVSLLMKAERFVEAADLSEKLMQSARGALSSDGSEALRELANTARTAYLEHALRHLIASKWIVVAAGILLVEVTVAFAQNATAALVAAPFGALGMAVALPRLLRVGAAWRAVRQLDEVRAGGWPRLTVAALAMLVATALVAVTVNIVRAAPMAQRAIAALRGPESDPLPHDVVHQDAAAGLDAAIASSSAPSVRGDLSVYGSDDDIGACLGHGNPDACARLGDSAREQATSAPLREVVHLRHALRFFAAGCGERGSQIHGRQCCLRWGQLLEDDRLGPSQPEAVALAYQRGCDAGGANSCFALGQQRMEAGQRDAALGAYSRACLALNHASACYRLWAADPTRANDPDVLRLACDDGTGPIDACTAWDRLPTTDPAASGRAFRRGCRTMGRGCVLFARSLPLSDPEGVEALERGCDRLDADSCDELGRRYRNGLGVERDYPLALNAYRRGCVRGGASACAGLAFMCRNGHGACDPGEEGRAAIVVCEAWPEHSACPATENR